jgi:general secretion pathway protein G
MQRRPPVNASTRIRRRQPAGFTLIEMLVVMAVLALLLTLAVPRYMGSVDRSKEAVLRENLSALRQALDKYHGDNGRYPDDLETLVARRYLRSVPRDPITGSAATWLVVAPDSADQGGVLDVRSGAAGTASDGSAYQDW